MNPNEEFLPIVQIIDDNVEEMLPEIKNTLANCSFIALDVEMSGIGGRRKLFYPEIDIRYKYMVEAAQTYSTVSFGISCFKHNGLSSHSYDIKTYNVFVKSQSSYSVEPDSLIFLRSNGFDFNRQIDHGLPYLPGNDILIKEPKRSTNKPLLKYHDVRLEAKYTTRARQIFSSIVSANKPVVFHNGIVDLIFLYQHFHAELPGKLDTLMADLTVMFPKGIYDTKYMSEFVRRVPASYLKYVYAHEFLRNYSQSKCNETGTIGLNFPLPIAFDSSTIDYFRHQKILQKELDDTKKDICHSYAYHGWCSMANQCSSSHSLSRIVEELKGNENRDKDINKKYRATFGMTGTMGVLQSYLKRNSLSINGSDEGNGMCADKKRLKIETIENAAKLLHGQGDGQTCDTLLNTTNGFDKISEIIQEKGNNNADKSNIESNVKDEQNSTVISLEDNAIDKISIRKQNEEVNVNGTLGNVRKLIEDKKMNFFDEPDGESSQVNENTGKNVSGELLDTVHVPLQNKEDNTLKDYKGNCSKLQKPSNCDGHSSGYDAFMTGFIFASFVSYEKANLTKVGDFNAANINLEEHVNKLHLTSKNMPLHIKKNSYSKVSLNNAKKIKTLRKTFST